MARNLTRVPLIPLDYARKAESIPMELLIDYDNGKIYARSKDGSTFLAFNKSADDHIANADIHVTAQQKQDWTNNIASLFDSIDDIINNLLPLKAPLASPIFTGTPKSTTPGASDNSTRIATTEFVQAAIKAGDAHSVDGKHVDDNQTSSDYLWTAAKIKAYVDSLLSSNDAMVFKGTIGTDGIITALPTTGYQAGWSYKVITKGTYAGNACEPGDLIICVKDYVSGSSSNDDWTVVQTNLDGAVTSSSTYVTNEHVVVFDGTSGKVVKTSGKALPSGNIVGDTDYGTTSKAGVVKSSTSNNKIAIETDGTMTVNLIDVTKGGTGKNSIAANAMLYASADNTFAEVTTTDFGRSLLAATSGTRFANLNADMVDGLHVIDSNGTWGAIPVVRTDGVIELGKYINFHLESANGKDYDYRLINTAEGELTGNGRFVAPEIKATNKFNMNNKFSIQYNNTDDCIEFAFA